MNHKIERKCSTCNTPFIVPLTESVSEYTYLNCPNCRVTHPEIILSERKTREVQVSDGTKVKYGSLKHVKDLQSRINSLVMWRDQQRRGSEARANYARLVSKLKSELVAAQRFAEKEKSINENYATEPDAEQLQKWEKMARGDTTDAQVRDVIDMFGEVSTLTELDKAKNKVLVMIAGGHVSSAVSNGFLNWLYAQRATDLGYTVKKLK